MGALTGNPSQSGQNVFHHRMKRAAAQLIETLMASAVSRAKGKGEAGNELVGSDSL